MMRTSDSLNGLLRGVDSSLLTAMTGMEGCRCLAPAMEVAVVAAVAIEVLDMTVAYNGYEKNVMKDSVRTMAGRMFSHSQHRARNKNVEKFL